MRPPNRRKARDEGRICASTASDRSADVEPRKTLLDALRENFLLNGTHAGCEHGVCGACTVLLDGEPVRSCLMFAVQADGYEITTIEGLAPAPGELSVLQDAFCETHGLQCGYCTPGMILAAHALLQHTLTPTREDIVEAISGNICRCTGYGQIIEAVEVRGRRGCGSPIRRGRSMARTCRNTMPGEASEATKRRPVGGEMTADPAAFRFVSTNRRVREDRRFVAGRGHFVADVALEGMLHVAILPSQHPAARIVSIDASAALAMPGVHYVLTRRRTRRRDRSADERARYAEGQAPSARGRTDALCRRMGGRRGRRHPRAGGRRDRKSPRHL